MPVQVSEHRRPLQAISRRLDQCDHPAKRVSDEIKASECQLFDHLLEVTDIVGNRVSRLRVPVGLAVAAMIRSNDVKAMM